MELFYILCCNLTHLIFPLTSRTSEIVKITELMPLSSNPIIYVNSGSVSIDFFSLHYKWVSFFASLLIFYCMLVILILFYSAVDIFVFRIYRNICIPLSWDAVRLFGNSLIFLSLAFKLWLLWSKTTFPCSLSNIVLITHCPENYEIFHSD